MLAESVAHLGTVSGLLFLSSRDRAVVLLDRCWSGL